jgi:predicted MFS family arabinose efflux permease
LYAAATEGIAKAWISNITDKKDTATAIGSFAGFQSLAAMIASSLAGVIWFWLGPEAAFISTSVVTVLVIFYFVFIIKPPKVETVIPV